MASTIQVRIDDELKAQSDSLFKDLGIDTTAAIRMFLKQAVAYNGIPFEIRRNAADYNPYEAMAEDKLLEKLERSRNHAKEGKYRDAGKAVSELRDKYGL